MIRQYLFLLFIFTFHFGNSTLAQNKQNTESSKQTDYKIISYEVLENGDTINKKNAQSEKIGEWVEIINGRYNEPDRIENGLYENNVKVGVWKSYTSSGKIISQEFYLKGRKSGEAKYYEDGKLFCVGNYLALKADYDYDTIMVEDPVSNKIKPVILKANMGSVRHGFWTYYDIFTHEVIKVLEYQADDIIYEKDYAQKIDSTYIKQRDKDFKKGTPPPNVMILDKNKKSTRFTDFPENTQYVKPNTREKIKR
ncbi:MAG: MORN variant repeat protein [Bacteroidetes bacterium OLB11]|nr:MAG: MORN variant repeat protein [Bacteroidetes bacterium OLB11]